MINDLIFKRLVDEAIGDKIIYNSSKCLRNTNLKDKCNKCFVACPEEAIELNNKMINIDNLICTGCGKCVSICPNSSLNSKKNPYTAALLRIKHTEDSIWGCHKSKKKIDVDFGCVRMIDETFLEGIKLVNSNHKITIDFSNCEDCSYLGKGLIDGFFSDRKEGHIKFVLDFNNEVPNLSRRAFLKNLLEKGNDYKDSTIKDLTESLDKITGEEKYSENLDEINLNILSNCDEYLLKRANYNFIFNLKFNNSCTFCKKCVSYCPQEAIFMRSDGKVENINYDVSKCTFCNLCIEKCEFNAIEKVPYENLGVVHLKESKLRKCSSCNIITTDIDSNGLCETCAIRENNRKKFNLHRRKKHD